MFRHISLSPAPAALLVVLLAVPSVATVLPTGGLRAQFQSDVGVLTSGSNVTQWNDQAPLSGSNDATASGTNPTYGTAAIGYHAAFPVVTFGSGTPLVFTLPSANAFAGVTILAVASRNAPNNPYETVLSTGGLSGSGGVRWAFSMGNDPSINQGFGWAGPTAAIGFGNGTAVSNDTWSLLTWSYDKTAWSVRTEYPSSVAVSSPADTSFFTGTWNAVIGTESSGSPSIYAFSGQVAELLIYDHKLTTTEYQDAVSYLTGQFFVAPVPEPSTFALLGVGIVGLAMKSRRRRAAA